ncbi:MCE family protein [Mycobacterium botniense]|uniref:Mammalian cell entry protein n=1 Tax=Mycobacterium botniense TaxID=84962 RepID=A0A7I9XWZ8_9MYCO|nr:MlaD family protein [Mycobacterium botniense]GFG74310.1 mammalian cell entry protein [Mycobacterium botniense]
MKITGTAIRLGTLWLVLLMFTVMVVVVFGQVRFNRTTAYSAVFTSASGLRAGQFVRAAGVEVGKVSRVRLIDGDRRVLVDFTVDRSLPLDRATTASIRYLNLIGDRYLELKHGDSGQRLAPGATIPVEHTQPALDLDALIGGFRPLFRSLDPDKVNTIAQAIITVFQGQGGTIVDIIDQTASLTASLADRDHAIGEVINNLNTVLATTVKRHKEFDQAIGDFEELITGLKNRADPLASAVAHISSAAGTLADLLGEDRPLLHGSIGYLDGLQQPLIDRLADVDDVLAKLPAAYRIIGRAGGLYGDFFNFYLCDISLKINGLQPGGPVRTVKLFGQPTGRCTPQ